MTTYVPTAEVDIIGQRTDKPLNMKLFCHIPAKPEVHSNEQ